MSIIYGTPLFFSGGTTILSSLPPLLDNFKAVSQPIVDNPLQVKITLSANKLPPEMATDLAGAVWVYGDHQPDTANDGRRIELQKDTVVGDSQSIVEQTLTWDTDKDFYVRQFTYNEKKQYQTMMYGAVAFVPAGSSTPVYQSIINLSSKSKVKLGKFNGQPLQWLVCRDTHDQSLKLILDTASINSIGYKVFDSREPSHSDTSRRMQGNNRYIWSNIRQWLNSSNPANSWYSAQHSVDAPPDYTNIAGFLHEWTENEIGVLENASWIVTKHSIDGGGTESFQDKVVLPSSTEMGLESNQYGAKLDIFNSNEDRMVGNKYWTRTPNVQSSSYAYNVTQGGYLSHDPVAMTDVMVRPMCQPLSNTQVSLHPDSDGCYTVVA